MKIGLSTWLLVFATASCAQKVQEYCDEETECSNPATPYCDLHGEHAASDFISNTCIPYPWDAGVADAGPDGSTLDAVPTECIPSSVTCEDDVLTLCSDNGAVESTSQCNLGCFTDGTRCNDLAPSNGLGAELDEAASAPAVVLAAGATIDTNTGTITGTNIAVPTEVVSRSPVDIMVVKVGSLTAQDISVTGDRALAIVSDGDVVLSGVVGLSANYQFPGPGALAGAGPCRGKDGSSGTDAVSGGGGGGFGSPGGAGGTASVLATGGAGGTMDGSPALEPLRGGCQGGQPGQALSGAAAGAGGGALQVVSRTKIELRGGGFVVANGGSAKAYTGGGIVISCQFGDPCGPGSGGGSGGAILLEAPELVLSGNTGLVANGGAGHCGTEGRAEAPTASDTPAAGTACVGFSGGDGAAGTKAAGNGTAETMDGATGAGGGGGSGRIRVNLPSGMTLLTNGAVISPSPSVGVVAVR